MPDVFLSYSREDQATARRFAEAFQQAGLSVWWDQTLTAGEAYDEVTEQALKSAGAVVVLWSKSSVASRWVRAEATIADRNNTLVPVMIGPCERPVMFELRQSEDLSAWSGDVKDPGWLAFLAGVKRVVKRDRPSGTSVPEATVPADLAPAPPKDPFRRVRSMLIVAVALIVALTGTWLFLRAQGEPAAVAAASAPAAEAPPEERSIAVLPFRNISSDPEQEYFSDGLSEELLNELTRVPQLRVIGRASSFAFKGKDEDLRTVGEALGVNHILQGSVRKAGDRVRISAQLINPADGSQIWSDVYERKLEDIFAIQEEIARTVAQALRLTLATGAVGGTRNFAAYDEFLAGRAALNSNFVARTEAVSRLGKAVALDPEFVTAWLWLIDAYVRQGVVGSGTPEGVRLQDEAIDKVVSIAPETPEASFALSYRAARENDLSELERLLREATALTGSQGVRARFRYGQFLSSVGRQRDAISAFEGVNREEPLDVFMRTNLLLPLELAGEFDRAEAAMQDILKMPGGRDGAVLGTAVSRAMGARDPVRLRSAIEEASAFPLGGTVDLNSRMLALLEDPLRVRAELRRLFVDPAIQGAYGYSGILQWAAYIGDNELALQVLEEFAQRQASFETWAWILWRPVLKDVRREPRARELMRGIGLVDYWRKSGNWGDFCKPVGDDDFECR